MKKLFAYMLSVFAISAQAKDNYPTLAFDKIPEKLKTRAHAVYRYDSTYVKVEKINSVRFIHNYAITILDEEGLPYSKLVESYNNNVAVNDLDATLLDASGKEIKSLKNREVHDYSAYGGSVYEFNSDERYKIFDFQQKVYPYTIIFSIDETIKTLFFLPGWTIRNSSSAAVESSYLGLSFNNDNPIRFKEYQLPESIAKTQHKDEDGLENYTWSISNLPVLKKQHNSLVGNYAAGNVQLSPTKFQLYGHDGALNSWKDLGTFIYQLNVDRDELPEDKKTLVKSMVANEPDTYAKIQKLYAYMQSSTRYVADEYGISGFQAFEAKDVCRTGYGDCKGLVNYMKALLRAADIKAYTTLVSSGADYHFKLDRDFPANDFDHVILCVPQPKDTIWIECTSPLLPAGYLGYFTQNRDVLITTEKGGILARTPVYNQDNNYIVRKASMKYVPETGNQIVTIDNQYFGPMQDDMFHFIKTKPEKEVREAVNQKFAFPTYVVKDYKYQNQVSNQHIPSLTEKAEVTVSGITNSTQKRTFINLAWMRNPMADLFQTSARTLPIVLDRSFAITDSIIVELPDGMEIESMPSETHVKQPFAEYDLHFEKSGKNIVLIRKFLQKEGIYDIKLYEDYQKMFNEINAEKDNLQIVALNKAS